MPKYKRYGYVVVERHTKPAGLMASTNIGFHLNPQKAQEQVDGIIEYTGEGKVVADETVTGKDDLVPSIRRNVLIEYPGDETLQILIQRWYVEVGRDRHGG